MSSENLVIFGDASYISSVHLLKSLTNRHSVPFVSWSNYGSRPRFNFDSRLSNHLFLRPDLSKLLIKLIEFYKWSHIIYIYNHDQGDFLIK